MERILALYKNITKIIKQITKDGVRWRTGNGDFLKIADMDTEHITNCVVKIHTQMKGRSELNLDALVINGVTGKSWVKYFMFELKARNLKVAIDDYKKNARARKIAKLSDTIIDGISTDEVIDLGHQLDVERTKEAIEFDFDFDPEKAGYPSAEPRKKINPPSTQEGFDELLNMILG